MTKSQLESIVKSIVKQEISNLIKNPKFIQLIKNSILQETLTPGVRQTPVQQRPAPRNTRPQNRNMAGDVLSDVNYASQNNYQTERRKPSGKIKEVLRQKIQSDDLGLETDFWGDEFKSPGNNRVVVPEYIKNNPLMQQTAMEMAYQTQAQNYDHRDDNAILREVTSGIGFEMPTTDNYRDIDYSVNGAQVVNEFRGTTSSAMGEISSRYNEQVAEVMDGPSVMDLSENAKRKFSFLNKDYGELI